MYSVCVFMCNLGIVGGRLQKGTKNVVEVVNRFSRLTDDEDEDGRNVVDDELIHIDLGTTATRLWRGRNNRVWFHVAPEDVPRCSRL